MKLHRVTLYVIDFDHIGADEVRVVLEHTKYPNRCIRPNVAEIATTDIGEWHDDHPLNMRGSDPAEWFAKGGDA